MADSSTGAFYAANAATYVQRDDVLHPALAVFLEGLPRGCRILELGCGGGRDARHMIEAGFDVDATDGVAEMAAEATQWLGRPARVMPFDALVAVREYDAVVANASLLHVPKAEIADVLRRIWIALKPGGQHFATYKTGKPEGVDQFGRYYNQPSSSELDGCYESAGKWSPFRIDQSFEQGQFAGPSAWLTVSACKAY
jgi:SAM-dependent methyltransferase